MKHALIALTLVGITSVCSAADLSVGPYSYDPSYGAFPQPACDACLPGITPALSHSYAVVASPTIEAHPDMPWLKVRVNGRETPLGKAVGLAKGQQMIPVTAAIEFGLTPTRAADNHRRITLAGGDTKVILTIGSRTVQINGASHQLPVAPKWMKGKVYFPFVAVGKLLGWRFETDEATGTVNVATQ